MPSFGTYTVTGIQAYSYIVVGRLLGSLWSPACPFPRNKIIYSKDSAISQDIELDSGLQLPAQVGGYSLRPSKGKARQMLNGAEEQCT